MVAVCGKKTKILLGAGAAAVLVVIALVLVVSLNQPYTVLFTGLNQTDLTAIVSYLSDNGVTDYQIQEEDTVLVPESQEEQLKAALLIEGYPNSGSGYSMYLDHVSSLTTESERSQLALYDLQDRLAGVIRNFPLCGTQQSLSRLERIIPMCWTAAPRWMPPPPYR